jgi:hypothetical protein
MPAIATQLDQHAEELDCWFREEDLTLSEACKRLSALGCSTSIASLSRWRRDRHWDCLRRELLEQIGAGANHCRQVELEFGTHAPPELETLIKVHRMLVLKLSAQTDTNPDAVRQITALMKPVMDWARLLEQRKERELAEQKYRDQLAAQKAEREREQKAGSGETGLTPEILDKIERELNLM